ncbi:MAG TPA: FtsQ-type POTRA domain-containing protein, partial [Roseiflexaceae bacterium]|nr:FtsQ-type POTRA domain-containing protein [Roseiflexaceae bacterium]
MNRFDYNKPNTRERLAARRKVRSQSNAPMVIPGPRRAASVWLASGRVVSLVLLIASLGGLVYIATAPRFVVRDIQVKGAQTLAADQVAELAGVRGQTIWFVDTATIADRLKTNAYIERADAYLALPDTLTIDVAERRPELRWRSGSNLYLIDASGRVLSDDAGAPLTNTLVIEDRSNRELQPNDMVDPLALKLGRAIALRLPTEANLSPAAIGWDGANGIVVTTTDGRTIMFGRGDDLDSQIIILDTILNDGTPFT